MAGDGELESKGIGHATVAHEANIKKELYICISKS